MLDAHDKIMLAHPIKHIILIVNFVPIVACPEFYLQHLAYFFSSIKLDS